MHVLFKIFINLSLKGLFWISPHELSVTAVVTLQLTAFHLFILLCRIRGWGEGLKTERGLKKFPSPKKKGECLIENLQYIFVTGHPCYCQLTLS